MKSVFLILKSGMHTRTGQTSISCLIELGQEILAFHLFEGYYLIAAYAYLVADYHNRKKKQMGSHKLLIFHILLRPHFALEKFRNSEVIYRHCC